MSRIIRGVIAALTTSGRDRWLLLRELADVRRGLEEERALLRILDVIEERDFERHVATLRD